MIQVRRTGDVPGDVHDGDQMTYMDANVTNDEDWVLAPAAVVVCVDDGVVEQEKYGEGNVAQLDDADDARNQVGGGVPVDLGHGLLIALMAELQWQAQATSYDCYLVGVEECLVNGWKVEVPASLIR